MRLTASAVTFALLIVGWLVMLGGLYRIHLPHPGFFILSNRVVISIGSPPRPIDTASRVLFSELVAADHVAITGLERLQRHIATRQAGEPVTYGFQAGGEIVHETLPVRTFTRRDYVEVYVIYFLAGFCFSAAGLWTIWHQPRWSPGPALFFVFCQTAATILYTMGDLYGNAWFEQLNFAAHCLAPFTLIHLTANFPTAVGAHHPLRRLVIVLLYVIAAGLYSALRSVFGEPALFLPLLYTLYLLLLNAVLLYVARLAVALWFGDNSALRGEVRGALFALFAAAGAASVLVFAYTVVERAVSPAVAVAPAALFPILTAPVMTSPRLHTRATETVSVRMRLSLLFLGAVETTFLIAAALFWVDNSRYRLFDELQVFHKQLGALRKLQASDAHDLEGELARGGLTPRSDYDRFLLDQVREAVRGGDHRGARDALWRLEQRHQRILDRLESQRRIVGGSAATLIVLLVAAGMAQAFAFVAAVQRWLLQPVRQLAEGTNVIATGDLAYRIRMDESDEFGLLGQAINRMAQSLGEIQRKVDAAREARREAADSAREAERRRLARELHDSVLQDLGAVKLELETAMRKSAVPQLQPTIDRLIAVINELRRVVDDLRPTDLSVVSLREAITTYARTRTHGANVQLHIDLPEEIQIPEWVTRDALRVAQEAVNNAMRHGSPSHLGIYLYRQEPWIVLEITDDGPGFDPDRVVLGGGIRGMRERAAAQGGELEITSVPGEGTMIRMLIPAGSRLRRT